jgi:hypothetical protein
VLSSEFGGQDTAEHELAKKGWFVEADIHPEKPLLQEHPFGTPAPFVFAGQVTAEQELAKKGLLAEVDNKLV